MDYKECWERLEAEIEHLTHKDVHQIDPVIVLSYMAFIYEVYVKENRKEEKKFYEI